MSCEKRFDSAAVRVTTEVRQIHMWVVICSLCAIRKESGICVFAPASRTGRGPVVWIGQVHPPTGGVLALDQGPDSPACQRKRLDPDKRKPGTRPRRPSICGRTAAVIPAPNPPYADLVYLVGKLAHSLSLPRCHHALRRAPISTMRSPQFAEELPSCDGNALMTDAP
ncbi:hypothetical protein M9X92_010927 [Pyricularia oryzae]|nr:hypothetical protein M9X92_010927 [Pyricularia oryzae]